MKHPYAAALAALTLACATVPQEGSMGPAPSTPAASSSQAKGSGATPVAAAAADNPLLREWTGPYGGVPAWDQVKVQHFGWADAPTRLP